MAGQRARARERARARGDQEIRRGGFRSDLYYRLNVIALHLPPLRDREDDIALLAEYFLRRQSNGTALRLSSDALDALLRYEWPGNVRELENALERAAIRSSAAAASAAIFITASTSSRCTCRRCATARMTLRSSRSISSAASRTVPRCG